MKKKLGRKWISLACTLLLLICMTGCSVNPTSGKAEEESSSVETSSAQESSTALEESKTGDTESASQEASTEPSEEKVEEQVQKNGAVVILFTSDIHCGIDEGFGLAGLAQIRANYEAQGYETILVDNGDAIQGETIGTLTKGEAIIDLMNELKYDVATPGNHEFDYGMDRFLELTQRANFPYVSCNFNKRGELVFAPYVILEAAGKKIAFVGITTPKTITTSTPAYFQNEQGLFVYGFYQDEWGDMLFQGVQKA
ncbi:MAG: metallophosphoesterase, partial [Lachnospiraceae bacterium]|nr:metallophosphoesterase [Lachnospiraceae bacterium]